MTEEQFSDAITRCQVATTRAAAEYVDSLALTYSLGTVERVALQGASEKLYAMADRTEARRG